MKFFFNNWRRSYEQFVGRWPQVSPPARIDPPPPLSADKSSHICMRFLAFRVKFDEAHSWMESRSVPCQLKCQHLAPLPPPPRPPDEYRRPNFLVDHCICRLHPFLKNCKMCSKLYNKFNCHLVIDFHGKDEILCGIPCMSFFFAYGMG